MTSAMPLIAMSGQPGSPTSIPLYVPTKSPGKSGTSGGGGGGGGLQKTPTWTAIFWPFFRVTRGDGFWSRTRPIFAVAASHLLVALKAAAGQPARFTAVFAALVVSPVSFGTLHGAGAAGAVVTDVADAIAMAATTRSRMPGKFDIDPVNLPVP